MISKENLSTLSPVLDRIKLSAKYVWILHNSNVGRGRTGYYVTAIAYTYEEASTLAKGQKTRLVSPILESETEA